MATAAMAALALWLWLRPAPPAPVSRYRLSLPPDQAIVDDVHSTFAVAPDGSWFVYVGPGVDEGQLWVKRRSDSRATPLAGTTGARAPAVSPSSQWIAFVADGRLRKIPAGGGPAVTLADSVQMLFRGPPAWLDDGTLVFTDTAWRLKQVSDAGGPAEVVWTPASGRIVGNPTALPGGRGVLFLTCDIGCVQVREAWVLDLREGTARVLLQGVELSWYARTGHLVHVLPDGAALAARFDLDRLELAGPSVPLFDGVQTTGIPDIALAPNGTLLYVEGEAAEDSLEAVWVDRAGNATIVDPDWRLEYTGNPGWALSPDGTRLAIGRNTDAGQDIWIKQLDRGPLSRLTFHPERDIYPHWTADGTSVTFISTRAGPGEPRRADLYAKRADGTGPVNLLLDLEQPIWEGVMSRDGSWLVIRTGVTDRTRDLWGVRLEGDTVPVPLATSRFAEKALTLSPDARWLAYESDESGTNEVYVRPFPDTEGGKSQISMSGGVAPLWANNGRELFYVNGAGEMVAASFVTEPVLSVVERRVLFSVVPDYQTIQNYTYYDVSPDDTRFLMVWLWRGATGASAEGTLIIVENWFEELKAAMRR